MYFGAIMLTLIIAVTIAAVVTFVMPRRFASTAVVQVKRLRVLSGNDFSNLANEIAMMRSQMVLKNVVRKLNLTTTWGKSEEGAVATLSRIIATNKISGMDLVEIKVVHTNPEEACNIATGVFEAYSELREDKDRQMADEASKALEKAVLEQTDVVDQTRMQRDNLLREISATSYGNYSGASGAESFQGMLSELESQMESATAELAELDNTIKTLDVLKADELIHYASYLESASEDLKSLYPNYKNQAEILLKMKVQKPGTDQSTVLSQQATVDNLYKQMLEHVVTFKESLTRKRASKLAELENQKKRLAKVREEAAYYVAVIQNIQTTQTAFETQKMLLDRMSKTLASERIALSAPYNRVALHEAPTVAHLPNSPNVLFNLSLGAGAGLLLGTLIALLMKLFQGP